MLEIGFQYPDSSSVPCFQTSSGDLQSVRHADASGSAVSSHVGRFHGSMSAMQSADHATSQGERTSSAVVDALDRLADEIRVVRDVLEELREDLNWIVRNERSSGYRQQHSVLKEMAADPASEDWGERLEIGRSTSAAECDEAAVPERQIDVPSPEQTPPEEPGKLF